MKSILQSAIAVPTLVPIIAAWALVRSYPPAASRGAPDLISKWLTDLYFLQPDSTKNTSPSVKQRTTDGISSCDSTWMPRDNVFIAGGSEERVGFSNAVDKFCEAANGQQVASGDYLSMASEVFISGGKDPSVYGILGFVYCKLVWKPELQTLIIA